MAVQQPTAWRTHKQALQHKRTGKEISWSRQSQTKRCHSWVWQQKQNCWTSSTTAGRLVQKRPNSCKNYGCGFVCNHPSIKTIVLSPSFFAIPLFKFELPDCCFVIAEPQLFWQWGSHVGYLLFICHKQHLQQCQICRSEKQQGCLWVGFL